MKYNELSDAQEESLVLLAEECGEVVQCIGKILRHGLTSRHPTKGGIDNREWLTKELGDVLAAIKIMRKDCAISNGDIIHEQGRKLDNVGQWLHYNHIALIERNHQ